DHLVDDGVVDLLVLAGRLDQLGDERPDAALGDIIAFVVRLEPGGLHDLVEQRAFGQLRAGGRALGLRLVRHGATSCGGIPGGADGYWVPPMPSSDNSLARAPVSSIADWMVLRKAGTLPSGPFSASSAWRSSSILASSGTWRTTCSGSKSFMLATFS